MFLVEFGGERKKFRPGLPQNGKDFVTRVLLNKDCLSLVPYVMSWRMWSHGFGLCWVDWLHFLQKVSPLMLVVLGRFITLCFTSFFASGMYSSTVLSFSLFSCYCSGIFGSFEEFMEFRADCAMQQGLPMLPLYNRAQMNSVKLTDWIMRYLRQSVR